MSGDEGNEEPEVTAAAAFATESEAEVAQAKWRACGVDSALDDQVEGGSVPIVGEDGVFVEVRAEGAEDALKILDVPGETDDAPE